MTTVPVPTDVTPAEACTDQVLRHASVSAEPRHHRQVVVGVDESDADLQTVGWAAGEARRRGAELIVVHAWSVKPAFGYSPNGVRTRREVSQEAAETLDRAVNAARQEEIEASSRLIEGDPAEALVHVAADAELLVLGHRRRRRVNVAIQRSVAFKCARHASCPVVMVPAGGSVRLHPEPVGSG